MEEGLVLPVDVGDEVLGPLGQVQNGLQVDDLGAGGLYRGVLPGQQLQVAQLLWAEGLFCHDDPPDDRWWVGGDGGGAQPSSPRVWFSRLRRDRADCRVITMEAT